MTYVMADIHGYYDKYLDFLESVDFGNVDTLYIIGDIIDRGPDGIKMLKDVMKRENIIALMGNHERMMLPIFDELYYNSSEAENIINEELAISNIGQEQTLKDFASLSQNEKSEIMSFIKQMPIYIELSIAGQNYILVHAGLPDFEELPLEYYDEDRLIFGPHDFYIKHYKNAKIIVGHLPTRFIKGAFAIPDEIFHSKDTIAIDCGLGFGGKLGVICLETGEEMYF